MNMQRARIMMIEGDADLAETVAEGLDDWGVAVDLHLDARSALERLLDDPEPRPDLVVLDMPPPLEDLQWFLEGAKADARTASVPIVATVSVRAVPSEIVRHCAHFVWKPYTIDTLVHAMGLVLRRNIHRLA